MNNVNSNAKGKYQIHREVETESLQIFFVTYVFTRDGWYIRAKKMAGLPLQKIDVIQNDESATAMCRFWANWNNTAVVDIKNKVIYLD